MSMPTRPRDRPPRNVRVSRGRLVINFRFHIISLVAVFLALGIGLAMGAAFIDKATVDTLRGQLDGLQEDKDNLERRVGELEDQLDLSDRLAEDGGLQLLAGHLVDVPVVLVSVRGDRRGHRRRHRVTPSSPPGPSSAARCG